MSKQATINRLIDTHEERIIGVLKTLEDRIRSELTSLTEGGASFNTKFAIEYRPKIKALIESTFLKEADSIIREYDEIVKEYQKVVKKLPIDPKFKSLQKADLEVVSQLKFLSFTGFNDIANRFLDTIANEVYQSALIGRAFNDMVKNIAGQINGVYQRSNENAINRLVAFIEKNRYSDNKSTLQRVALAKSTLASKYGSDILGENMRKYASLYAHDSLMKFDGQFVKYKADQAGIKQFKYAGTRIDTTRNFCARTMGRIFTEQQAKNLWQNQRWKGKSGNDPFVDRGGYRCRHSFTIYNPEWENILEE
tara:strand:- start:9727 stop:10653 length:927 start_codon:yes stop_codon:yes gene_type:complete